MIDYNIPNDSKAHRKKIFTQLMTPDPETGYMDGEVYQLMRPYAKNRHLTLEQRLWLAVIYGLSYSCTTTMRFLEEFPTISEVKPKTVKSFWKSEKSSLWFNPDKRYLKNNDQVIPAIRSIIQCSHGNLESYLVPLLKTGFDVTYKEITKRWQYFGPHGTYLFFDAIYGMSPEFYTDPENLDWKNCGHTVAEGMAHLLCEDEMIETKSYDIPRFNKQVNKIASHFKCPKMIVESNLCFFRKLFKGSRYLGYYADRDLEECLATADILENKYHINVWDLRQKTTQDDLRGEIHGWSGIRKEKLKEFLLTGELL